MNGAPNPSFDPRIASWLEDDPATAPAQVLETVIASIPSIPQRRAALRVPWSVSRMYTFARALVGVAVVAIVAGGLILASLRSPATVGGPSVTPSPPAGPSSATTATYSPGPLDGTWSATFSGTEAGFKSGAIDPRGVGTWKLVFGPSPQGSAFVPSVITLHPGTQLAAGSAALIEYLPGGVVQVAADPGVGGCSTPGTYHYVLTGTTVVLTLTGSGDSCLGRAAVMTAHPWIKTIP